MTRDSPSAVQAAAAETTASLARRVEHVVFRALAAATGLTPRITGGKFTVELKTAAKHPPTVQIFITDPEEAVRPEFLQPKSGPYSPGLVSSMLALVEVTVPDEDLKPLVPLELALLFDWASREHLAAADNLTRRRPKPHILVLLERTAARRSRRPGRGVAANGGS